MVKNVKKSRSFVGDLLLYPSFSKIYKVDYFQVREDLWRAKSQVEDPIYNVIATIDVSVPDFIIHDCSVRFLSLPHKGCLKAAPKMKELIGADVHGPYREVLRREFLGPQGCDTIFNLVNMSGKGLAITYLTQQAALGAINDEDYQRFYEKATGCIIDQTESPRRMPFIARDCVPAPNLADSSPHTPRLEAHENEPLRTRRFTFDYFELNDVFWRVRSRIEDLEHNFLITLDVSTEDFVIRGAEITFLRQPRKGCSLMKTRIKSIVGACLATDFRRSIGEYFAGVQGCAVANNLLHATPHGFMQFYLMRNTILGRIKPVQDELCREGLKQDCIACFVGRSGPMGGT